MTQKNTPASEAARVSGPSSFKYRLAFASIGVVFGDIGTSPLYAMREALHPVVNAGGRCEPVQTSGSKFCKVPCVCDRSALPPKADICSAQDHVRQGPEADTAAHLESSKGGNAYLGHLLCK